MANERSQLVGTLEVPEEETVRERMREVVQDVVDAGEKPAQLPPSRRRGGGVRQTFTGQIGDAPHQALDSRRTSELHRRLTTVDRGDHALGGNVLGGEVEEKSRLKVGDRPVLCRVNDFHDESVAAARAQQEIAVALARQFLCVYDVQAEEVGRRSDCLGPRHRWRRVLEVVDGSRDVRAGRAGRHEHRRARFLRPFVH